VIETRRLLLIPAAPEHLLLLIEKPESFEPSTGRFLAAGLRDFYASGDVSPAWLAALRRSTAPDPWRHGFFVVQRDMKTVLGTAGFKGPPDGDGMVEIAYGIAPGFQGQGYATEAAAGLVDFAFATAGVRLVRAHTRAEPNASTRVLLKNGFHHCGMVIDPDDGPVWRWELDRRPPSPLPAEFLPSR
jgi:RimJ/RimL family protein N-acetyltransferase